MYQLMRDNICGLYIYIHIYPDVDGCAFGLNRSSVCVPLWVIE